MHRGLSPRGYDFAEAERVLYDAYGRQTVLANNGVVAYKPSDYGQFVGFTGRYHDWETGLQYFRARYFDNSLGRFIGRDPLGYADGMSLYSGYFVPNDVDPMGLMTHEEVMKWFNDNKEALKKQANGRCKAFRGAVASAYVEMRRMSGMNKGSRFDTSAYVDGTVAHDGSVVPNVGNSYGNAAIKPKDIEQLIAADKTGQFADITKFASNTKEFRQAVANMLLNEPLRVATARSQYYIDQWNEARKTDPTVAKIEDMPEILATLYNLGPNKSVPKATPGIGGSWNITLPNGSLTNAPAGSWTPGARLFGDIAKEFINSEDAKKLIKEICPCE